MTAFGLSAGTRRRGEAAATAAYIERSGPFASRRLKDPAELGPTGVGNMPAWADTAATFWSAADEFERKNGRAANTRILTLPRGLTAQQHARAAAQMAAHTCGTTHPFSWAVHNATATDGLPQPHIHLMWSSRELDGIERPPDRFFSRYNSAKPEKGGARKATTTSVSRDARAEVMRIERERFAAICNEALIAAGVADRVDARSNTARGIERPPEPKLRPDQRGDPAALAALQNMRRAWRDVAASDAVASTAYDAWNDRRAAEAAARDATARRKADARQQEAQQAARDEAERRKAMRVMAETRDAALAEERRRNATPPPRPAPPPPPIARPTPPGTPTMEDREASLRRALTNAARSTASSATPAPLQAPKAPAVAPPSVDAAWLIGQRLVQRSPAEPDARPQALQAALDAARRPAPPRAVEVPPKPAQTALAPPSRRPTPQQRTPMVDEKAAEKARERARFEAGAARGRARAAVEAALARDRSACQAPAIATAPATPLPSRTIRTDVPADLADIFAEHPAQEVWSSAYVRARTKRQKGTTWTTAVADAWRGVAGAPLQRQIASILTAWEERSPKTFQAWAVAAPHLTHVMVAAVQLAMTIRSKGQGKNEGGIGS